MQSLFLHLPGLVRMSAQASILVVLVLAAQWLFGKRLQPRWRCALWLLVLLRLALPWTIPSPASLFNVVKLPAAPSPLYQQTPATPAISMPASQLVVAKTRAAHVHWLAWLWVAGALSLIGGAALNHYRLHRRVTARRPLLDAPTLNLLEDCKGLMGVRTPVTLIETAAVESPALFGFVRPRLLLPAGLAVNFDRDELRHVFLHELGHIKRHDVLLGWAMLLLQALHWFNPLVWLAFHRMRADRELACDALALSYAQPGENESYGLTIVKLLEGFGRTVWAPSLAGILEDKQQMKERITMIAKFHKTNRGLALAIALFAGLALVTLRDPPNHSTAAEAPASGDSWNLELKVKQAEAGNQWAAYELWDAYYRGKHGVQPDTAQADKWLGELVQNVWVVRFEPVDDFTPSNPGEFLARIHQYSSARSGQNKIGAASFFRTTRQGDKLVGSFLSNTPDDLKASLSRVPGLKVTSIEPITPEQFVAYEQSPQESMWSLQQKIKQAEGGNQWAVYDLWDAYHRGNHGVQTDPVQADKWLGQLVQNLWVVRFEPVGDFAPATPEAFLGRINQYSSCRSGQTTIGAASFFRTTKQGDKLVGSFLSTYPDKLKDSLAKVPGLNVTSVEQLTPAGFVEYEKSPQESL